MAMELFKSVGKVNLVHVPYKGTGPAMTDLLGGHIALMFDVIMTSLPPWGSSARLASAV